MLPRAPPRLTQIWQVRDIWVCREFRDTGAIAQLGERMICIHEVRGSIPRSSTSFLFIREIKDFRVEDSIFKLLLESK